MHWRRTHWNEWSYREAFWYGSVFNRCVFFNAIWYGINTLAKSLVGHRDGVLWCGIGDAGYGSRRGALLLRRKRTCGRAFAFLLNFIWWQIWFMIGFLAYLRLNCLSPSYLFWCILIMILGKRRYHVTYCLFIFFNSIPFRCTSFFVCDKRLIALDKFLFSYHQHYSPRK